jgi:hypothetical protein
MIGADLTDTLIVLNTDEAVRAFAGNAQLTIGADIEVAVGFVGRSSTAEVHLADTQTLAPAFSYSQSKGLYAGVSLDGSVLVTRTDLNHKFYGRPVQSHQLLSGEMPSPRAAAPLYTALAEALSAVPDVTHRPPSTTSSPATLRDHHLRRSLRAQEVLNNGSLPASEESAALSSSPFVPPVPPPRPPALMPQRVSQYHVQSVHDDRPFDNNSPGVVSTVSQPAVPVTSSTNFSFAEFWQSFFAESHPNSNATSHYATLSSSNINVYPSVERDNDDRASMRMSQSGYAGYEGVVQDDAFSTQYPHHAR